MEDIHFYRFRLGSFDCVCVYDGFHDYTLESMVINAPAPEVEAALQKRGLASTAIRTPYTYLVVDTGSQRVLVDTGAGNFLPNSGKLVESMQAAGITPESIAAVFLTHAHPDHIGGVLDAQGNEVFRAANYYICKAERDFWFSEQAMLHPGSGMTEFARQRLTPIQAKTILIEQEGGILPGVSVLFTPGHTPGHMAVSFTSQGEQLIYSGDTVLHPLHLEHPEWLPSFDILPAAAAQSKQRLFDMLAEHGIRVIGQHFPPFPGLGHIIKKGAGWDFVAEVSL
jgi:glyoxylase-like metal-dependent hydrolase (beta-lactamase superfamily II)